MDERSKDNQDTFRQLLRNLEDSPTEKLVRRMLANMMGNCPKDLIVRVGSMMADHYLEELKLYDARN